jgi:hypothetical protein
MDDKLYLIDKSSIDGISEEFHQFFTDFIIDNAVAIITDKPGNALPDSWITQCKYIFASDGNEVYINGKLRYRSDLLLSIEAEKWVSSLPHPTEHSIAAVRVSCDPYISASLVREFNELFAEFRAYSCIGGFRIVSANHNRRHCAHIIDPNYAIRVIAPTASYGGSNFELVKALSKRATTFYASKTTELHELLQYFLEK